MKPTKHKLMANMNPDFLGLYEFLNIRLDEPDQEIIRMTTNYLFFLVSLVGGQRFCVLIVLDYIYTLTSEQPYGEALEDGWICWSVESGYAGLEEIHKTTSLEMLLTGGEYLIKYQTRWFVQKLR